MKFLIVLLAAMLILVMPYPVEASANPVEADCGETYRVVRGDWLSKIANRCGVTVKELMQANPEISNPERIFVGQVIHIPGKAEPAVQIIPDTAVAGGRIMLDIFGFPPETEVEIGIGRVGEELISTERAETDERGRLSTRLAVPETAEEGENWVAGAISLSGDQTIALSDPVQIAAHRPAYTVKRGDRLSLIANNHQTSVAAILDFNPEIENPNRILVGQRITLPPEGHEPSSESVARARTAPVPPGPGTARPTNLKPGERWIDVNLSTQSVHAYEGDTLVRSFIASTGLPRTPTVTGQYRIYVKFTKTDMRGPGYHLRDVPYTMYFHRGYGLHGTYWHDNFGTPMSAGCVNLRTEDAQWLFNFASVGTLVSVHH